MFNRKKYMKIYGKIYRYKNKIKLNEYSKKYHKKHKKEIIERHRKYRLKNKEKLSKYYKIYPKRYPYMIHLKSARCRCNNKNNNRFKDYGKRGIKCFLTKEEIKYLWLRDKAQNLIRPSLDRINPDKNYNLENCRFVELIENIKRKRPKGYRCIKN